MASEAEDAEAKRFQTLPGQANLYVFRDIGVGTALTFQAAVDGRLIGLIARNTYQLARISPGEHTLRVSGNGSGVQIANSPEIQFTAEAETNYFFIIGVVPNLIFGRPRGNLSSMNEDEGRRRVLRYRLAQPEGS